jgi:hypothetical protein
MMNRVLLAACLLGGVFAGGTTTAVNGTTISIHTEGDAVNDVNGIHGVNGASKTEASVERCIGCTTVKTVKTSKKGKASKKHEASKKGDDDNNSGTGTDDNFSTGDDDASNNQSDGGNKWIGWDSWRNGFNGNNQPDGGKFWDSWKNFGFSDEHGLNTDGFLDTEASNVSRVSGYNTTFIAGVICIAVGAVAILAAVFMVSAKKTTEELALTPGVHNII